MEWANTKRQINVQQEYEIIGKNVRNALDSKANYSDIGPNKPDVNIKLIALDVGKFNTYI